MDRRAARDLARRLGDLTRIFGQADAVLAEAELAEEKLGQVQAAIAEAETQAASLRAEVTHLASLRTEADAALAATLKESRARQAERTRELAEAVGPVQRELEAAKAALVAVQDEVDAVTTTRDAAHAALTTAETELAALQDAWRDETIAQQARIAGLTADETRLQAALDTLRADLRALHAKIPTLDA